MAVYARGYRPYEGTFRSAPVALVIMAEGARMALARKGVRRISGIIMLTLCVFVGILYFQFGIEEQVGKATKSLGFSPKDLIGLNEHLRNFYGITTLLASIAGILVGAGLVADDLRTRALALYLVRPVRPRDYMLGKSLVIPVLMIPLMLLPGLLLWLIVGLWQPPGETWAFLEKNADIALRVVEYYAVGALSLTGLMLILSSRTSRRGAVMGLAAAALFGGPLLRRIGMQVAGPAADALLSLDVMNNMTRAFKVASPDRWERRWAQRHATELHPSEPAVWVVAAGLLLAGLYLTWRRARTVEVSE